MFTRERLVTRSDDGYFGTGLKHLHRVSNLKSFNLTNCQLSELALDNLQDALPWCRITR